MLRMRIRICTKSSFPLNFQSLGTVTWCCKNCYNWLQSTVTFSIIRRSLTECLSIFFSIISHMIVFFFLCFYHFHPLLGRVSDLNREDSVHWGWEGRECSTSVTVRGLKVGQKAPAGCCYARTIDQPGFYLYIRERERALLGYGGRAIDGTRWCARASTFRCVPGGSGK